MKRIIYLYNRVNHLTERKRNTVFIAFFNLLMVFSISDSQTAYSQSSWYWLQPLPTGATLNSVDFFDGNTGYTCGKAGTITKTTNGGVNWFLLGQITTADLNDIICLDANTCFTVGNSGVIFRTTNGGLNWHSIPSGVTSVLYGINFPTGTTGYISGTIGTLLKTTNGGDNWTFINVGVTSTLFDVSFINPLKGAMAGINNIYTTTNGGLNWTIHQLGTFFDYFQTVQYINDSTIYGLLIPLSEDIFFVSNNGGLSWNSYSMKSMVLDEISRSMNFKDETTGFAVSNFGNIHKTTNAGINWFLDTTFTPENRDSDVFYEVNSTDTSNFFAVGSGGFIVRTTNTGALWEKQTGVHQTYNDVYFMDDNTGFVVGEKGVLNKTTDAGISWSRIELSTSFGLNKIVFVNPSTGYICGDSGVIKKTINSGVNWFDLSTPATDTNLISIYFLNLNTGFLGTDGGSVLKTTNSGLNWRHVFTITGIGLMGTRDIDFLNENYGVASGDLAIYFTTNSGENWTSTIFPSSFFNSIKYIDTLNLIAGGFSGSSSLLKKSTDGGVSWFNLSITHKISSMFFQDYNFGIACGDNGNISRTTNGGLNWTLLPRIATENLHSIFFSDPNTGYSVGMTGQIIKTTNGGLSFLNVSGNLVPDDYILYQNYPNPFNPETIIKYSLKKNSSKLYLSCTNL